MPPIRAKNRSAWMKEYNARQRYRKNKAARRIQRKWRKGKRKQWSGMGSKVPYSTEKYQMRLGSQSVAVAHQAGSATNGPANSMILLPVGFNEHTTFTDSDGHNYSVNGSWLKPLFWSTKVRISFDHIIPTHAESNKGFIVRMYHGLLKNTCDKMGGTHTTQANLSASVLTELKKELYESDISADFLDYSKKNRNLQILGKWVVKPNRNQQIRMIATAPTPGASAVSQYSAPPPVCYTIKHKVPPLKQRVTTDTTHDYPAMIHTWVPWILVCCDQLNTHTGTITAEHSGRMYFTDN